MDKQLRSLNLVPVSCTRLKSKLLPARWLRGIVMVLVALSFVAPFIGPAEAQRSRLSLVRDAEIEALIKDYARPLLKAARLRQGSVEFYLVNNPSFNAFVSGRGMFINTGLLLQSETPGEVIGVIAHEIGHIIGAHQIRLRERIDNAKRLARISSLLGLGLGVAGAASGNGDVARAGLGVAQGGAGIGLREVLRYQRGEETSADTTAATLLEKTGQSGRGMLTTFKRLGQQLSGVSRRANPYLQSHPLPRERVVNLTNRIKGSKYYNRGTSANLQLRHDMVRAKIAAYTGGNRYAQALLQDKRLKPIARLYGQAIVTHLYGDSRKAVPQIDRLLKKLPKNAYVHEMRGEIYLRSGKARQAVRSFKNAVKLDKTGAGFIRIELGHALVESGSKKNLKEAVIQLNKGLARDPNAIAGYQHLANAYGQLGQPARALLASAELASRTGRKKLAKQYARRSQAAFKRGSPPWLRAEDIINQK